MSDESRDYIRTILGLYLGLPETPGQSSRLDRQLALEWFKQEIPLPVVETAFLLGSARRLARDQKAIRLGPPSGLFIIFCLSSRKFVVRRCLFPISLTSVAQSQLRWLGQGRVNRVSNVQQLSGPGG